MNFASDNAYGAHPAVMQALVDCNDGAVMGYGADPVTARATAALREVFEAPEAIVRFVATGTAANALVCAQLSPGYGRIYCHRDAHIETSECGAPEFFSGGGKLITLPGDAGKLRPDVLKEAIRIGAGEGLNGGCNAMVSLTNATELGTVYSPDEVAALCEVSHAAGLPVHMDGARFANAMASLDAAPADVTWRAGVDALCFGGTKNGAMAAEAVLFFDPDRAEGFDYRRKQSGHVFSKQRFLAAQMLALSESGLWLDLARRANCAAVRLAEGVQRAGGRLLAPVESNAVFAEIPLAAHQRAVAADAKYHLWPDASAERLDPVPVRLVTSWNTPQSDIDGLTAILCGET
ncbi:threonine aldolase family protein [Paracoccus seriniphilus]|uniref:L-threonine aldolase n=1 Tax=Paracoccus seriniphilus TaxID=184748 RepID=A0A239PQJ6_9RHOB|nr:beta-eliminating lyase-related protein [Paracoccus seriniphilus]WCR12982.1 low specificity L-threonine aldolase [Paracoccus seriniphilus]SNT72584.1 L-threonine aldolase [Paracoccus seriniphilus]